MGEGGGLLLANIEVLINRPITFGHDCGPFWFASYPTAMTPDGPVHSPFNASLENYPISAQRQMLLMGRADVVRSVTTVT